MACTRVHFIREEKNVCGNQKKITEWKSPSAVAHWQLENKVSTIFLDKHNMAKLIVAFSINMIIVDKDIMANTNPNYVWT